jgi:hypothetical protein
VTSESLRLRPVTVKDATRWVTTVHRHHKRELAGARFAVQLVRYSALNLTDGGVRVGVAVVTSGPRVWEGTGRCNIARVATDGSKNACSMLYGAMCRAAAALGYREAWTYTLPSEPGTSLRASGFDDMGLTSGGEHDRPRQAHRRRLPAEQPSPKRRWRRILVQPSDWELT